MKVLVIGAGVSGRAAAGLARRLGHGVSGVDDDPDAAMAMRARGFEWAVGWDPGLLDDSDMVIVSPGVPPSARSTRDAIGRGLPVVSELEFAAGSLNAPMAAVTGTNGKTSTVSAAVMMLEASGVKACAAGNIGTALSDVAGESWEAVVVEASSFQLHFIDSFHPAAAGVLNIATDHIDWHGSRDAYVAAKARIVENLEADDLFVFGADDPDAAAIAAQTSARTLPVSGSRLPTGGAGVENNRVRLGDLVLAAPDVGPAFLEDLVMAAAVAEHLGATPQGISAGLAGFMPGSHRRRLVGEWNGIRWIDDSKATNPHAAVASAGSFESVVLIAGGLAKGVDLGPMSDMASVHTAVVMGESADDLVAIFGPSRAHRVGSMEEAVALAGEAASPGDTVLLAPGCASFDMFDSYGHRGDVFAAAVVALNGDQDGK